MIEVLNDSRYSALFKPFAHLLSAQKYRVGKGAGGVGVQGL